MSKPDDLSDDSLGMTPEVLDQWESELDAFAAGILRRLAELTEGEAGAAIDGNAAPTASPSDQPADDPAAVQRDWSAEN
jgi:hypothetical protein